MSFFNNISTLFGKDIKDAPRKPMAPVAKPTKPNLGPAPTPLKPKKVVNQPQPKMAPKPMASSDVETSIELIEAKAKAREIIVEAKDEALAIRSEAEQKARELNRKLE